MYTLYSGSDYNISGQAIIKEKIDGSALVTINISRTQPGLFHPTHIHLGAANESGETIKLLNPVDGATGSSSSVVSTKENGETIGYIDLIGMETSIKVHLSDGEPGKGILLAGGNIGASTSTEDPFGRFEMAICGME